MKWLHLVINESEQRIPLSPVCGKLNYANSVMADV